MPPSAEARIGDACGTGEDDLGAFVKRYERPPVPVRLAIRAGAFPVTMLPFKRTERRVGGWAPGPWPVAKRWSKRIALTTRESSPMAYRGLTLASYIQTFLPARGVQSIQLPLRYT